jgi:hypothetical protein
MSPLPQPKSITGPARKALEFGEMPAQKARCVDRSHAVVGVPSQFERQGLLLGFRWMLREQRAAIDDFLCVRGRHFLLQVRAQSQAAAEFASANRPPGAAWSRTFRKRSSSAAFSWYRCASCESAPGAFGGPLGQRSYFVSRGRAAADILGYGCLRATRGRLQGPSNTMPKRSTGSICRTTSEKPAPRSLRTSRLGRIIASRAWRRSRREHQLVVDFEGPVLLAVDQHVLAGQFDHRILVQIRVVSIGLIGNHRRHSDAQDPIRFQQAKRFFESALDGRGDVFENVAR